LSERADLPDANLLVAFSDPLITLDRSIQALAGDTYAANLLTLA
jgi:hypothetical protein